MIFCINLKVSGYVDKSTNKRCIAQGLVPCARKPKVPV